MGSRIYENSELEHVGVQSAVIGLKRYHFARGYFAGFFVLHCTFIMIPYVGMNEASGYGKLVQYRYV